MVAKRRVEISQRNPLFCEIYHCRLQNCKLVKGGNIALVKQGSVSQFAKTTGLVFRLNASRTATVQTQPRERLRSAQINFTDTEDIQSREKTTPDCHRQAN